MIEKIEEKITAQVNSILKKDFIDFYDYQILIGEINRLKQKESQTKSPDFLSLFLNLLLLQQI